VEKPRPSEALLSQIAELHSVSAGKAALLSPAEAAGSAFLAMAELLQKITDAATSSDEESNELFARHYSVCLRGGNPFKENVLKKADVDSKAWKRLLREVSGGFSK
jgi:hypothetical protein